MRRLHKYIESGGNVFFGRMPLSPPFDFDGVRVMVFPLRANISKLNDFCRNYLLLTKDQEYVFRPAAPYVYLMILHYGKMGSAAATGARNLGWVAQNEVTFTVPLECWKKTKGISSGPNDLEFQDWAGVSPFIYVDDQVSMTTGREVYGWPKTLSRVELASDEIRFPSESGQVFRLTTHVSPRYQAGMTGASTRGPLVEIESNPYPLSTLFPPNLADPWAPWNAMSGLVSSTLSVLGRSVDDSLAVGLRGYQADSNSIGTLLQRGGALFKYVGNASMSSWGSFGWHPILSDLFPKHNNNSNSDSGISTSLNLSNITVKQFLDAERPHLASYQAIVQSTMGIKRIKQMGMLGELSMLQGDASGGYSIRIYHSALHPIISSLGLEVIHSPNPDDENDPAILKPIFPYWSEFDLNYGKGRVLMSHSLPLRSQADEEDRDFVFNHMYNSTAGAASKPVAGPIHYPDATLKVYALEASTDKLRSFVGEYLGGENGDYSAGLHQYFDVTAVGRYVYLVVKTVHDDYGAMWSESDQLDWWAEQSVQICVPVRWSLAKQSQDSDSNFALISVYSFSSSNRASIADREVNGKPTTEAWIDVISLDKLSKSEPSLSHYMSLRTEVFRSFDDGEPAASAKLLEVIPAPNTSTNPESTSADPESTYADNVSTQQADQSNPPPGALPFLTLKQYRDAENPQQACYQALVLHSYTVNNFHPHIEAEKSSPLNIYIHHYPSHPIVESLGLSFERVDSKPGADVVYQLSPKRVFQLRISLEEQLGKVIALATSDGDGFEVTDGPFLPDEPARKPTDDDCLSSYSSYQALYQFFYSSQSS